MKYQKTIDLWAFGIQQAIVDGTLKIQRGQWVSCGGIHLSRYVGHTKQGIFNVVHFPNQCKKFSQRVLALKTATERKNLRLQKMLKELMA